MKGTIKTYLPEKKYGFILGDDGKSYFFHASQFNFATENSHISENAFVEFEQHATPKGYSAKKCVLLNAAEVQKYLIPTEVVTSRTNTVRNWEIVETGNWLVHGSSSNSPDAAKEDAITGAKSVGATGLVNFEYYKTTGSTPGTGKGTYYYTIHNFRGQIVSLARRNTAGNYNLENISGLNERAESLKLELTKKTNASKRKNSNFLTIIIILSLGGLFIHPGISVALMIYGFFSGGSTNYDDWLQRLHT